MKKILFAVVLLISIVSCKNTEDKKLSNTNETTEKAQVKESTSTMQGLSITDKTITKDWNGKEISKDEFMKYLKGGEYIYVPKTKNGELVEAQLQKPTAEQMELLMKMKPSDNETGKQAPDFEVKDINGKTYKLSALKDKTVVLNFWFTSCKPCKTEMPLLNKLVADNKNTVFIAFATDKEKQVSKFLKTTPFNYNIVADSKDIAKKYEITAYPTHYVIKNGIIQNKFVGYSPNIQDDLQAAIDGHFTKKEMSDSKDMNEPIMLNSNSDIRDASGKKLEMMDAVKLMNSQKYTMENAKDKNGKKYILIKKR